MAVSRSELKRLNVLHGRPMNAGSDLFGAFGQYPHNIVKHKDNVDVAYEAYVQSFDHDSIRVKLCPVTMGYHSKSWWQTPWRGEYPVYTLTREDLKNWLKCKDINAPLIRYGVWEPLIP